MPSREMLQHLANSVASDTNQGHSRTRIYADRIAKLKRAPTTVHVPLQTICIGELGVAAIPFETFAEIGLELKDRGPFEQTFTIELANGSYGYLPTPRQHRLGGYETWLGTNFVEFDASIKIVNSILGMFDELDSARRSKVQR
jgi:hypothetical protein